MSAAPGVAARKLAVDALVRIDTGGAYANLTLPAMLERSHLADRDRAFVTELVYGTTRMRRSCDWLVDRFLPDPERMDATARAWLRLGAFQLAFLDTPAHAGVGATVEAAPKRLKGLCNAVLRKVATSLPVTWPSDGVRVSQPDWIVSRLTEDLGAEDALAALDEMNRPASVTMRADGYVQDRGSQWVAEAVAARAGERILDMCAAPGGKATYLAGQGATVVAADVRGRPHEPGGGQRCRTGAGRRTPRRRGGGRDGVAVPGGVVRQGAARRPLLGAGGAASAARCPAGASTQRPSASWPTCSGGCWWRPSPWSAPVGRSSTASAP